MASKHPPNTLAWIVASATSLIYCLAVLVPWRPGFYSEASLDSSWEFALHSTFARGLRYGRDVLFTFGPFGFLFTRAYTPETFGWTLASWATIALVFWGAAWYVARRAFTSSIMALLWTTPLIALAGVGSELSLFLLALLALLVFFTTDADRAVSPIGLLLCGMLAWAGLIRFTHFVLGVSIVALVTAVAAFRGQWIMLPPAAYAASLTTLWLLAGQKLGDLPSYLRWSFKIAGGYTEAMSSAGPQADVSRYVALSLGLLACLGVTGWRTRGGPEIGLFLGIALLLFVAFKAGYVRHDAHALSAVSTLLAVAVAVTPEMTRRLGRRRGALIAGVLCVLAAAHAWMATRLYADSSALSFLAASFQEDASVPAAALSVLSGRTSYRADHEAGMRSIRTAHPLPEGGGSVDVYSYRQAAALARGLRYSPRPVIQGYAAYSPELAETNAAHLRGERAPDRIFFDAMTIDDRFPALDDAASWPELLTRYDIRDVASDFLVLDRAPVSRRYRLTPIRSVQSRLGRAIAVPGADVGPIWVSIDLRPTWLGRLADIVYKRPSVLLEVAVGDARWLRFRLIPAVARSGFLLSPVVGDIGAFLSLASPDWRTDLEAALVRAIRVSPLPSSYAAYGQDVTLSFSRLELPAQDISAIPALVRPPLLKQLFAHPELAEMPVAFLVDPVSGWILLAHAPSRFVLPPAEPRPSLRVAFGLLEGAWQEGGATDGVRFRISSRRDGHVVVLWSQWLDPCSNPADRGRQTVTLDLREHARSELVFETLEGSNGRWDWSYWAAAE